MLVEDRVQSLSCLYLQCEEFLPNVNSRSIDYWRTFLDAGNSNQFLKSIIEMLLVVMEWWISALFIFSQSSVIIDIAEWNLQRSLIGDLVGQLFNKALFFL